MRATEAAIGALCYDYECILPAVASKFNGKLSEWQRPALDREPSRATAV
jgi:hypothetical protein